MAHRNNRTASASSYSALPVTRVNPLSTSLDHQSARPDFASSGKVWNAASVAGLAASARALAVPGTLTPRTSEGKSGKRSAYVRPTALPMELARSTGEAEDDELPRSPTPMSSRKPARGSVRVRGRAIDSCRCAREPARIARGTATALAANAVVVMSSQLPERGSIGAAFGQVSFG